MKVYTKVVIDMDSLETLEEESYEYDGPVAEAKGGVSSTFLDPMNLTGNRTNQNQNNQFNWGAGELMNAGTAMDAYKNWLNPLVKKGMGMVTPGSTQYQNLWNMTANDYKNQMEPQLAGAGVLTSGPGLNAMDTGMRNLSTQFTNDQMQNFMKMFGLTGGLESGVPSVYSDLMRSLFSNAGNQVNPGGSLNIANMFGASGAK